MKRKGLMRFLSTGMTSIVLMTSAFPTTVYAQPVTEEPETAMSVEESSEAGLTEGTEQSEDVEHTESEEQSQTQESEVQTTETAEETQETRFLRIRMLFMKMEFMKEALQVLKMGKLQYVLP